MAAAAGAGGRVRRAEERANRATLERAKLDWKRKKLRLRATDVFNRMSEDGEWLLESQVMEFLSDVLQSPSLHKDAVQLVIDTANRTQKDILASKTTDGDNGSTNDMNAIEPPEQGALMKRALIKSICQYGKYISKAISIDSAFLKYDKKKDGYLSRDELRRLITDYERKKERSVNGLVVNLIVTDDDLDWIMEQSDAEGNGKISQAEYLPALAAWEDIVQLKLKNTSGCCIIL